MRAGMAVLVGAMVWAGCTPCIGCDAGACLALTRVRPDDQTIGGTTALELADRFASVTGPVTVTWRDNADTELTVDLTPELGTARLHQRPDCEAQCITFSAPCLACPPDQVRLDTAGHVTSADGRLDESVTGFVAGHEPGARVWEADLMVPADALQGTLDPAEPRAGYRDENLIVIRFYGEDDTIASAMVLHEQRGRDGHIGTNLGSTGAFWE